MQTGDNKSTIDQETGKTPPVECFLFALIIVVGFIGGRLIFHMAALL